MPYVRSSPALDATRATVPFDCTAAARIRWTRDGAKNSPLESTRCLKSTPPPFERSRRKEACLREFFRGCQSCTCDQPLRKKADQSQIALALCMRDLWHSCLHSVCNPICLEHCRTCDWTSLCFYAKCLFFYTSVLASAFLNCL